jgi:hypothetical protein
MSRKYTHPKRRDYETAEDYEDAVDAYFDAMESKYEERMFDREED